MSTNSIKENLSKTLENPAPRLMTIKGFCAQHPWPSESAMRAYIFRASELKITEAFVRVRRRVLINENKFFELIQRSDKNCA